MTISEKSAYLKGLMEGMNLNTESNEGKMIAAIVDLLGDMAKRVTDIEETTIAISDELDEIEEDLDAIVESESYGECTGMAAELLESYPPEVALSALLRLAFKNELSESSYPEIRSIDVDRKGKARIFLAFGARDGYDTRKTVRLLKQECGLSDHDIDDVRVMEDFSFATVPFDQAEKVVRTLNKLSHGRPIAEISKDSPSARTSGGRQSHRRRESDTRSGRKTGRKPESRESYRQDSSVQEAFGAPDDRNGHRKSVRSPKTSGTKAGKKPATTVKASSKTYTPEKTAAKRASELPENWFEEWFGQRQPARNKKGSAAAAPMRGGVAVR